MEARAGKTVKTAQKLLEQALIKTINTIDPDVTANRVAEKMQQDLMQISLGILGIDNRWNNLEVIKDSYLVDFMKPAIENMLEKTIAPMIRTTLQEFLDDPETHELIRKTVEQQAKKALDAEVSYKSKAIQENMSQLVTKMVASYFN